MAINLIDWVNSYQNLDKLSTEAREHARILEVRVEEAKIEANREYKKQKKTVNSND